MIFIEIENGQRLSQEELFDFLHDLLWRYENGELADDDDTLTVQVPESIIAWAKKNGAEDECRSAESLKERDE
jgi:hypothetical protein